MHGCRLSISSLHLGCRENSLLSLLDRFVSLLLSALCRSALSCLASGVFMTCFMPRNSSPLLATMALMPTQLTYQFSVLLLTSRASMKWKISLIIVLVWRGRTEYLVKWRGYSVFESTWEPEANLTNCARTLAMY